MWQKLGFLFSFEFDLNPWGVASAKKISRKRLWKPQKILRVSAAISFYFFKLVSSSPWPFCCFYLMYASFRSVTDKNRKILTPTQTGHFLLTSMDRHFYATSFSESPRGFVRLGNLNFDFKIRISDLKSNVKSENGFQRWDICFWIFIFTVRLGNPKKDLKNCP